MALTPKSLRERAGLTQQDVAIALGKRVNTVSEWERGLYVPKLTFSETIRFLQLYGCTLEEVAEAFENAGR